MKKRLATLFLSGLIITSSCNEEIQHDPPIAVDETAIENFIKFIDFGLEEAMTSTSKEPQEVANLIANRIPEFQKRNGLNMQYQSQRGSSSSREIVRGQASSDLAQKIVYYSSISANESQYLSKLSLLKREVQVSGISPIEKSALLTQITLNERFVRYLQQKDAAYKASGEDDDEDDDEECSGWWSCWGKCAAGILGGAGTGALTFGFTGAAAGTVTAPVVGTISLGVVGAVAGGVAGGLAGAAASCD